MDIDFIFLNRKLSDYHAFLGVPKLYAAVDRIFYESHPFLDGQGMEGVFVLGYVIGENRKEEGVL